MLSIAEGKQSALSQGHQRQHAGRQQQQQDSSKAAGSSGRATEIVLIA